MKKASIREITSGAIFCALICVGAFIKIPLPHLPVTMQVFFVLLAGMILKAKTAFIAVGTYILLGLAGLPVFAYGGGIGYVLMPSFGYMMGFLTAACVMAGISHRKKSSQGLVIAAISGVAIIYAVGIPYFWAITKFVLNTDIDAQYILSFCIFTVLPGDIISGAAAVFAAKRLKKAGIFN